MTANRLFTADIEIFLERASIAGGYPPQDQLIAGLDGNFQFSGAFMNSTWEDATAAATLEHERLQQAGGADDRSDYFARLEGDDQDEDQAWSDNGEILSHLDVGIGTVVFALNAAGCLTTTGCSGHQLIPGRDHPYVAFHADLSHATIVRSAAGETGCGFGEGAEAGVLIVWATNIRAMVELGEALIARAAEFRLLPTHGLISPPSVDDCDDEGFDY